MGGLGKPLLWKTKNPKKKNGNKVVMRDPLLSKTQRQGRWGVSNPKKNRGVRLSLFALTKKLKKKQNAPIGEDGTDPG